MALYNTIDVNTLYLNGQIKELSLPSNIFDEYKNKAVKPVEKAVEPVMESLVQNIVPNSVVSTEKQDTISAVAPLESNVAPAAIPVIPEPVNEKNDTINISGELINPIDLVTNNDSMKLESNIISNEKPIESSTPTVQSISDNDLISAAKELFNVLVAKKNAGEELSAQAELLYVSLKVVINENDKSEVISTPKL